MAAYSWLEFAVGTDTTDSARRLVLVSGVFQMRPTYSLAFLDGVVPIYKPGDAPAFFNRDVKLLKLVIPAWFKSDERLEAHTSKNPPTNVYPLNCFPINNECQMQLKRHR